MPVQQTVADEEDSIELGEPPYIYSPYPDNIVKVRAPETIGQREVAQMIDEEWPADIETLEAIAEEMNEDGNFARAYSGSHIRNVLRNFYAPADMMEEAEEPMEIEAEEAPDVEIPEPESADDDWHKVFRMGIRVGLEKGLTQDEAADAFMSGFIEGDKLGEEIDFDRLAR